MNYLAQIEALLFVAGEEGLSLRHLASMVNLTPTALQQQLIEKISRKELRSQLFCFISGIMEETERRIL